MEHISAYFGRSIFYCAGGTDIQAIIRFSNISNVIISPTISENLNSDAYYEKRFKQKCFNLKKQYGREILKYEGKEINDARGISNILEDPFPQFFLEEPGSREAYLNAFEHQITENSDCLKATKFTFTRYITPNKKRIVHWITFKAEAISSLLSLMELTNEVPKIIVTIQTGIMELTNGIFARFMQHNQKRPKIWVRGYWDDFILKKIYNNSKGNPLKAIRGEQCIQEYPFWNPSMGIEAELNEEAGPNTLSHVNAFIKGSFEIPETKTVQIGRNKQLSFIRKDINEINNPSDFDLIICSQRFWKSKRPKNMIFWEELFKSHNGFNPCTTFESLKMINMLKRIFGFSKIAITPLGFEDEAAAFKEFKFNGKISMDVYHLDPFDFIDIYAPDFFKN